MSQSFFPFKSPVIEGTEYNWVDEVSNYIDKGVVFAIFVKRRSPKTNAVVYEFQKAANKSAGMIKFISLDIEENPKIAHLYTVRQAPSFRIIFSNGAIEYRDENAADSYIKSATRYIKSRAQIVDASWAPSVKTPLSAILMTNKKTTPPYWAAISNYYADSNCRIGTNRNPNITSLFGVNEQNCIVFVSGNIVSVYDGQLTYSGIISALEEFAKNPTENGGTNSLISVIDSKEKFYNFCHNTGKVCVLLGSSESTAEYNETAAKNRDDRFKFYICGEKCPFPNMSDHYFVFHHRNDRALKVDSIKDLSIALDHVVDGTARYSPFVKLFKPENSDDNL